MIQSPPFYPTTPSKGSLKTNGIIRNMDWLALPTRQKTQRLYVVYLRNLHRGHRAWRDCPDYRLIRGQRLSKRNSRATAQHRPTRHGELSAQRNRCRQRAHMAAIANPACQQNRNHRHRPPVIRASPAGERRRSARRATGWHPARARAQSGGLRQQPRSRQPERPQTRRI